MIRILLILSLGAGLLACSSVNTLSVSTQLVPINEAYDDININKVDSIVSPYRDSLKEEMREVIAYASQNFTKGRPGGALNNWAADAILSYHTRNLRLTSPAMCLLNVGGLRNPINQGDVTVGDIYKLMPFDNEVVWVEMPMSEIPAIEAYLLKTGGEPIAGAHLDKGKLIFNGEGVQSESFWILTSDYLMNGGDKMTFFEQRISQRGTGILLRDTFMEVAIFQKELVFNNEQRITFE